MGGETFEELDQLWGRFDSGWRRLLSTRMLRELELRSMFDLDLIDDRWVLNQVPSGQVPDCERCDDICCSGVENIVSLRLIDIATLIDVGRTDLINTQKPRFSDRMIRTRPMLWELMGSELFLTLPVLRQVGAHRICAALQPDLKCGLYPNWPLSCERFPYTLKGRRRVVWGQRCPSKKSAPESVPRASALKKGAVRAFNERIRDAVLLAHARPELDRLGIGAYLTDPSSEPFEEGSPLPIID